eukprot:scaffold649753_cov52-Prasinocladus_malaysianus.AAC.2
MRAEAFTDARNEANPIAMECAFSSPSARGNAAHTSWSSARSEGHLGEGGCEHGTIIAKANGHIPHHALRQGREQAQKADHQSRAGAQGGVGGHDVDHVVQVVLVLANLSTSGTHKAQQR